MVGAFDGENLVGGQEEEVEAVVGGAEVEAAVEGEFKAAVEVVEVEAAVVYTVDLEGGGLFEVSSDVEEGEDLAAVGNIRDS